MEIMVYQKDVHKRAIEVLGGKCIKCGFIDIRALQIDHIHGGGLKELRKNGNYAIYYKIVKDPEKAKEDYQVLCANCNWIKRFENKEIPNLRLFDPAKDLTFVEYVKYIKEQKNKKESI
jgi:hypothetical protein